MVFGVVTFVYKFKNTVVVIVFIKKNMNTSITISSLVLLFAVLSVRSSQNNDKHTEKVLTFGETNITIRRPRSIEPRHLLPNIFGKKTVDSIIEIFFSSNVFSSRLP